jgi:hypothetical protein
MLRSSRCVVCAFFVQLFHMRRHLKHRRVHRTCSGRHTPPALSRSCEVDLRYVCGSPLHMVASAVLNSPDYRSTSRLFRLVGNLVAFKRTDLSLWTLPCLQKRLRVDQYMVSAVWSKLRFCVSTSEVAMITLKERWVARGVSGFLLR